jgi:hypothetical protein
VFGKISGDGGLIVSENKTVMGSIDCSSLKAATKVPRSVGQDFEQIAKLFDHVTQTYVWIHDLMTLHYSDDDTDYPALLTLGASGLRQIGVVKRVVT